jgi:hypothetical protein
VLDRHCPCVVEAALTPIPIAMISCRGQATDYRWCSTAVLRLGDPAPLVPAPVVFRPTCCRLAAGVKCDELLLGVPGITTHLLAVECPLFGNNVKSMARRRKEERRLLDVLLQLRNSYIRTRVFPSTSSDSTPITPALSTSNISIPISLHLYPQNTSQDATFISSHRRRLPWLHPRRA